MAVFSGIAAAVGAVGTWFAGLGAFAQIAVRLVAGLAFNALSKALAGKPDKPRRPGITGQVTQGADLPRSFILGRYATAGSLVYHHQWGKSGSTPNAYYTRVTALSDLPVSGLDGVWVDGERMTLGTTADPDGLGYPLLGLSETRTRTRQVYDGEHPRGGPTYRVEDEEVSEQYGWVRFYDGTQTAADPLLLDIATDERPWSADDVGHGVAYAVVTFRLNRRLFNRLPEVMYEVDGVALTAPDGTADGASRNPVTQIWHLLKGLSYGGERLYGPATPANLDATDWQAQADLCDQPVPGSAQMSDAEKSEAFGSTAVPPRYRAGLEVDVSRDVADVIEDVLSACNGRAAYIGAGYRVQVGDPQAADGTLTDADILSTTGQTFAPFLPLAETVNSIAATYPEPDEGWQQQEAPPLIVSAYEDEERGRRLPTTVDLPAVPYREQVQRLMRAALAEARRARRHTVTLPARYWTLLPGDYLDWTSIRNGYDDKRFRVDGVVDLPTGDVQVDLTEVDPADYDWSAETDYAPVARGSITGQPAAAVSVSGFALAAAVVSDGTGEGRRPAILLSWTDPGGDDVDAVRWQVRLSDGTSVSSGRTPDVELLAHYIVEGILPAQSYQVRARFDAPGRPTPWTPWTSVTTLDIRLTEDDIADDFRQKLDTAFDRHDEALESATGTVAELRDATEAALGTLTPLEPIDVQLNAIDVQFGAIERTIDLDLPDRADVTRGLDTLAEQLLYLQTDFSALQSEVRDAGVYVDPASGSVRIEGIDRTEEKATQALVEVDAVRGEVALRATTAYVDGQIAQAVIDPSQIPVFDQLEARISDVEILADSNEGAIALKADTTELNGLESRVTTAELDIDSLEGEIALRVTTTDFSDLETRVTDAEVTLDTVEGANIGLLARDVSEQAASLEDAAITSLQQLLDAYEGRQTFRTDVALAKQDLRALVDEDRESIASLETEIGVRFGEAQALVEQEATARASETEALGQVADQIQANLSSLGDDVDSLEDDVSGQADALSTLTGRVEDTEDGLQVRAQETTALRSSVTNQQARDQGVLSDATSEAELRAILADQDTREALRSGIASARQDLMATVDEGREAVASLRTDLTAAIGDYTALYSEQVTALATETEARVQSIESLEAELSDVESGAEATALAVSDLDTRVTTAEGDISSQASSITQLETDLSTVESDANANASAISSLDTRVTSAEGSISSQSQDITQLQTDVAGLDTDVSGNALAIGSLDTRVTNAEGDISSQASSITQLETDVSGLQGDANANASAITQLDTRVTSAEGDISSQASRITSLETTVDDPNAGVSATASAVDSLDTRVTTAEGDITSNASAIQQLQSDVGDNSAAITDLATTRVTEQEAVAAVEQSIGASYNSLEALANAAKNSEFELDPNASGSIAATVNTIAGTYVDADGARAAVETEISAQYGSLTALATATQFAEATVSGIETGFVWSLGAGDVLSLVQVQDGTTEPVTTARIRGDYIRLDGTVQVTGDFGVTGENIILDGDTTVTGDFAVTGENITLDGDTTVTGTFSVPTANVTGTLSADQVQIDNVTLDTDGSGNLVVKGGGIATQQMAANSVTVADVAGSGQVLNNSSTWTTIAEFDLPLSSAAQFIQATFQIETTIAPASLPVDAEVRLTINESTRVSMPRTAMLAHGGRFMLRTGTLRNVPAGSRRVALEMRRMGGAGIDFSNLYAIAFFR